MLTKTILRVFFTYQICKTPQIRHDTILVRLWGYRHSPNGCSPIIMEELQNSITQVEGNLAIPSKITNVFTP